MPRSGSTLLCNILAQNPELHVSSTSPTANLTETLLIGMQENPEVHCEALRDEALVKMHDAARGMVLGWYKDHLSKTIIDKCRYWSNLGLQFHELFPGSKMIVMVRDVKCVIASIEKAHRRKPLLTPGFRPSMTMRERIDAMIALDGIVGNSVRGMMDMKDRGLLSKERSFICQYERLCQTPEKVLGEIYERLGVEPFKHDFEDVKDSSVDVDGLYWYKFPHHDATGKVRPYDPTDWTNYLPEDIGGSLDRAFANYRKAFKYTS
jgi:sulfotransferase